MNAPRTLKAIVLLGSFVLATGVSAQESTTLRVAMYPYVPDGRALFQEIEAAFEASHPGVNLELVETYTDSDSGEERPLSWAYYSGGLIATDADIYEIDTVLLDDMISSGKIVEIDLPERRYVDTALEAVQRDGRTWAVPHWVCGNFLIYRSSDSEIRDAATWSQLMSVFEDDHLLIDLKGTSTLGEWYLTSLALGTESEEQLDLSLRQPELNPESLARLEEALTLCPPGYCRSEEFHDRVGFYSRMFARGQARAYIGYSESIHYALEEIAQSCNLTDACIDQDEIEIREIPGNAGGSLRIGWADAFGLSPDLPDAKRRVAISFLEFITSWESYKMVLDPEWGESPRYLMPAVLPAEGNESLAPALYPQLYEAFGSRHTLSGAGVNDLLRGIGGRLDCELPRDRGDDLGSRNCEQ